MKAIPYFSMPQDIHNYEYEDEEIISIEKPKMIIPLS